MKLKRDDFRSLMKFTVCLCLFMCFCAVRTEADPLIDLSSRDYAPAERNYDRSWNPDLFYTLEDVSPDSSSDGKINGYRVTRKTLENAANGHVMEYEIYTNPSTGCVNKIVSIEYLDTTLEITDYYFTDSGQVNFIFVRRDTNYVPSYAVPDKDGLRYYFNGDNLVKWRTVRDGQIYNICLGDASLGENSIGQEVKYGSLSDEDKGRYNDREVRELNAAYITYHTVLGAGNNASITGTVYDQAGNPLHGAECILYRDGNEIEYETTGSDGSFSMAVSAGGAYYEILVSYPGMVSQTIYDIYVPDSTVNAYLNPVYLAAEGETASLCDTFFSIYGTATADGSEVPVFGADIYIRMGSGNRDGDVIEIGVSDADGLYMTSLTPGTYTAEIGAEGYESAYVNFSAEGENAFVPAVLSPTVMEGEMRIVLTWLDESIDLDAHLFTPYDSAAGDENYHIWYGNPVDAVGDEIESGGGEMGFESVTIPWVRNGLYKFYVADSTHISYGEYASMALSRSNAVVDVYASGGLVASWPVPAETQGALWEVFEIRNGTLISNQRYYDMIEDPSSWIGGDNTGADIDMFDGEDLPDFFEGEAHKAE